MQTVRVRDIAWEAGVYEGEGHVAGPRLFRKGWRGMSGAGISVDVTQVDPWLCRRLKELFGGSVRRYPYYNRYGAAYRWNACGNRARRFLWLVFPYLSPKRKRQIRAAWKDMPI